MMIGSFFTLMFYILSPVDLGLKKIFYTPMITTACVMRNRYIRCDDDVEIQQKRALLCWLSKEALLL